MEPGWKVPLTLGAAVAWLDSGVGSVGSSSSSEPTDVLAGADAMLLLISLLHFVFPIRGARVPPVNSHTVRNPPSKRCKQLL